MKSASKHPLHPVATMLMLNGELKNSETATGKNKLKDIPLRSAAFINTNSLSKGTCSLTLFSLKFQICRMTKLVQPRVKSAEKDLPIEQVRANGK